MKPYYDEDGITIYHGDCREIEVAADCVVTDPPYGIKDRPLLMGIRGARRGGDNTWHPESTWDLCVDPLIAQAASTASPIIAWFGHWSKREEVSRAIGKPLRAEIVWVKDMHTGPPCPLARRDERIWLFSDEGIHGRHFDTTVWECPVIPTWSHKLHKNEKPEALMRRLVGWLPGDLVLDPCMGSGTTLVAAKQLNRRAIGIEIEERYCEIAAKRLSQKVMQFNDNQPRG